MKLSEFVEFEILLILWFAKLITGKTFFVGLILYFRNEDSVTHVYIFFHSLDKLPTVLILTKRTFDGKI